MLIYSNQKKEGKVNLSIDEEASRYKRDVKKLRKDHKNDELEELEKFKLLIYSHSNFQEVMDNSLTRHFKLEQKSGNLKGIYTIHLNKKIRLWIIPVGEQPYKLVEIDTVRFVQVDDKHYGEG